MSARRTFALPLVFFMLAACNSGGTGQVTPSPSVAPSPSPQHWATTGTLAVYDGPTSGGHTVWVVGIAGATAKVLATVKLSSRTPRPAPACPPSATPGADCGAGFDLPYVSTSKTNIYVLDGDTNVRLLAPDGSLSAITSMPLGPTAQATFAVSPDDAQIAVGEVDFASGKFGIYVENLHGGGRVEVFGGAAPFYWPIRWRSGKIVLATGGTLLNPYRASGYALIDPTAGAQPVPLGKGDCVPSGTLTAAGTACIVRPGTPCLEGLVANAVPPYYYNSCLRRVTWDGSETTFLLPNNAYTSTFAVNYAALSPNGQEIMTDQLGRVEEPVSVLHGGNNFLGPGTGTIRAPSRPCMGWIDAATFSYTYVNPDGSSDVRLIGATFEGSTDIAPGVPSSPVNGDLVGTVPDEFDR